MGLSIADKDYETMSKGQANLCGAIRLWHIFLRTKVLFLGGGLDTWVSGFASTHF